MRTALVALFLLVGTNAAYAQTRSVFLAPPSVIGVEESVGVTVVASMAAFLGARDDHRVVTTEELKGILDHEKTKTMMGCDEDTACIAEVSAAANTDLVIATTVGKVGKSFVVSLTLVDPKQAAPLGRESATVPKLDGLDEAVKGAVATLLGIEGAAKKVAFVLPKGKKISFAVLDLRPTGVDEKVAANLTQLLSAAIKRVEGATVISRDDHARRAGEDKAPYPVGDGRFEEMERPRDVRIYERRLVVRGDVRFVERGRVHDRVHPFCHLVDKPPRRDRAHVFGERRPFDVHPNHIVTARAQHADESLSEMPRAPGD